MRGFEFKIDRESVRQLEHLDDNPIADSSILDRFFVSSWFLSCPGDSEQLRPFEQELGVLAALCFIEDGYRSGSRPWGSNPSCYSSAIWV
jgi:hypothetical protein